MEDAQIKCRECGEPFAPDLTTADGWTCPKCQARNPDLRFHYRVVAGTAGLGFVAMTVWTAVMSRRAGGMSAVHIVLILVAVSLLVAALLLAGHQAPWRSAGLRALTSAAFGAAFVVSVLWPLCIVVALSVIGQTRGGAVLFFLVPVGLAWTAAIAHLVWVQRITRDCLPR